MVGKKEFAKGCEAVGFEGPRDEETSKADGQGMPTSCLASFSQNLVERHWEEGLLLGARGLRFLELADLGRHAAETVKAFQNEEETSRWTIRVLCCVP